MVVFEQGNLCLELWALLSRLSGGYYAATKYRLSGC